MPRGTKTKTDAVRRALQAQLNQPPDRQPLGDRLSRSKALADALGRNDPSFDMKGFIDEMCGEVQDS